MHDVSFYEAVELTRKWAQLFDAHASPKIIYELTSGEDFAIVFGETRFAGLAGLEEHHLLKDPFFNESHLYYNHTVESDAPHLVITSQMIWETWRRKADGGAEHLIADLRHRWTFTRHPSDGRPLFQRHELLSMDYRPGFAPSETDSANLHLDPDRVGIR
jgi:hypothetical protein